MRPVNILTNMDKTLFNIYSHMKKLNTGTIKRSKCLKICFSLLTKH